MGNKNEMFKDGANFQAQCVLICMRGSEIEESYNKEFNHYDAEINVSRWENCREQGYVAMLRFRGKQLNIAWFEHRNSDSICAVMWEQPTLNAPTINNAKFGKIYKDKYDVSHSVGYGKFVEMSEWIMKQFTEFWIKNNKAKK